MRYEVRTKPWAMGLEIHIYERGKLFGVTQTHFDYPEDTVERMATDFVILSNDLPDDAAVELVISPLPPKDER